MFIAILAVGLYFSFDILVAVFLAIVISSGLNPFVSFLERIKIPRALGTGLVFLLIIAVFGIAIYEIIPIVGNEVSNFLELFFPRIAAFLNIDPSQLSSISELISQKIFQVFPIGDGALFNVSKSVLGTIALGISTLAMSFYLTIDHRGIEKFLLAVLPAKYENSAVNMFLRSRRKIGYWLQAQIVLSCVMGAMSFLALWTLGVKNAFVLGVLAGVFEIIPFVGPIFVGTLAVIVALLDSTALALYTLVVFIILQRIESDVLLPVIMNKAVGLHPVMVLIAMLVGANFFGIIGLLLAVPALVIVQEFADDYAMKKARRQNLI